MSRVKVYCISLIQGSTGGGAGTLDPAMAAQLEEKLSNLQRKIEDRASEDKDRKKRWASRLEWVYQVQEKNLKGDPEALKLIDFEAVKPDEAGAKSMAAALAGGAGGKDAGGGGNNAAGGQGNNMQGGANNMQGHANSPQRIMMPKVDDPAIGLPSFGTGVGLFGGPGNVNTQIMAQRIAAMSPQQQAAFHQQQYGEQMIFGSMSPEPFYAGTGLLKRKISQIGNSCGILR
jgi:hypothetical protein